MRFCGACGQPLVEATRETAQRRHMTVMFCDLVDSTPLAQALDPEDFREVLNHYRQACTRAIERFGGFTAVYAGDGMTVYFGYPRAHEDDAQRAVHTGLAIIDGIGELNARLTERYGIAIQIRIGVHSGVVIAEELGGGASETRSQLDVSGQMPHIAARLESVAPPGSIVVSDDTRALVDGYFESEPLGKKTLKGVAEPMGVHRILRPTGAVGRLEVAGARRLTPVVGREAELDQLREAWREVQAGSGRIAHVTGEAGIGKSRLVHELVESLGNEVGSVQRWQCSPHHQSTSLYPVTTYLERHLGIETPEQLEAAVAAAGIDPGEAVPLLADLLSIGPSEGATHGLTPRDARTAVLHILETLLVTDGGRHPLLLVVEDLHWADPTTVELLGRVARALRKLPILCVLTFRSGFDPAWEGSPAVALGPLGAAEVRAMAMAASDEPLSPTVLDWVETTSDGVPLFVEEVLKAGRAANASVVPPTLEGLLTERLDRLPELADVIDHAAILGREFDRPVLAALKPLNGHDLDSALAQLAEQDVLRPVDGAPARSEFSHGLLQEAAYARILRRRRLTLHRHVAETLLDRFPEAVEREPELVARHWSAADEPGHAVRFWHAAGTHALERAAYLEAADHFQRGLAALDSAHLEGDDGTAHIDFLTHIGASLQAGRGYAAAGVGEAYAEARSACERGDRADRLVPVIRGQVAFHLLRGEYSHALDLADEMVVLADEDPTALVEGHLHRGLAHMYLGIFDTSRKELEAAINTYRQPDRGDHIYEAQGDAGVGAHAYLAVVLWNLGLADESMARSDQSLERAQHVGGPVTRAQAWGMRSILHLSRAEPIEMGEWIKRTSVHSVDNDLGYWRTVSSLLGSWLRGRSGDLERGLKRMQESLDAYIASGSKLGLPHFHILAADLHRAAGDLPRAFDLLRQGEEYIEQTGERLSESELYRFKGRLLMAREASDPAAATVAFERAAAAARDQNAKILELQATVRLAEHQLKLGEQSTALERASELCDWFGGDSPLPDVARARALLQSETMRT